MTNLLGFLESYLLDLAKYRSAVKAIQDELVASEPKNRVSKFVEIADENYGRKRACRINRGNEDLFPGLNETEIKARVRSSPKFDLLADVSIEVAVERGLKEPYYYDYDDKGLHLPWQVATALQEWALGPKSEVELDMLAEFVELGAEAYNLKYPPFTEADFEEL